MRVLFGNTVESSFSQLRASLISLSFSELLPYSWERDRKLFKCRAAKLLSRAISGPLILEVLDEGDTMWLLTCCISEGLAANSWHTAHSNLYSDFYQVKKYLLVTLSGTRSLFLYHLNQFRNPLWHFFHSCHNIHITFTTLVVLLFSISVLIRMSH